MMEHLFRKENEHAISITIFIDCRESATFISISLRDRSILWSPTYVIDNQQPEVSRVPKVTLATYRVKANLVRVTENLINIMLVDELA